MANNNNNLALSTSGATGTAKRKTHLMNFQTNAVKTLGQLWKTLDGTAQSAWNTWARNNAAPTEMDTKIKARGYATFVALGTTQILRNVPVPLMPPDTPDVPASLPALRLNVGGSPGSTAIDLVPATAYGSHILLFAAKPAPLGENTYRKTAFKYIGSLNALAASTDISELYFTKYRLPSYGYQIALKVCGASATGTRTKDVFVFGSYVAPDGANLTLK